MKTGMTKALIMTTSRSGNCIPSVVHAETHASSAVTHASSEASCSRSFKQKCLTQHSGLSHDSLLHLLCRASLRGEFLPSTTHSAMRAIVGVKPAADPPELAVTTLQCQPRRCAAARASHLRGSLLHVETDTIRKDGNQVIDVLQSVCPAHPCNPRYF